MELKRKQSDYNSPKVRIVEFETNTIICQSNPSLDKGDPNGPDAPTPGPGGYIFGD